MNHGIRVTVLVVLVLALTLVCGFGGLLTALEVERLLSSTVSEQLPSVVAATELQKTLLEQRGIVATYFLDRNPGWLTDLDRIKPDADRWMKEARRTTHTAEEVRILDLLANTYRAYDTERERAIALYTTGHEEQARNVLVRSVGLMANQVQGLCQQLVDANQLHIQTALDVAHKRIRSLKLLLTIGMSTSLLLSLALLMLVIRDVLHPVQRLAQSARKLSSEPGGDGSRRFKDDLSELEFYSRALMADVSSTRTSLEESRRRLLAAENLAAVGKFAACVAHEIRNPLTAMKVWLYQIQQAGTGNPEVEDSCRVLGAEMSRLEDMATGFLELSRPPSLKLAPSDVDAIVRGTLELAAPRLREKGLHVVRANGTQLPKVLADADQLRQVLLNLVTNAAEVTQDGGEIRITESLESGGDGDPEVVVRVRDGGPGVPDQVRPRLFEPFTTTKPNGTGLGLCIASSIMTRHGGRLTLESSSNQGAVFAVHLPARSVPS